MRSRAMRTLKLTVPKRGSTLPVTIDRCAPAFIFANVALTSDTLRTSQRDHIGTKGMGASGSFWRASS